MKNSFAFIAIWILILTWGCETGAEPGDPQKESEDELQALKNQGLVIGDLNYRAGAFSGCWGLCQLQSPVFYSAADWAWRDLYEDVFYFNPTP